MPYFCLKVEGKSWFWLLLFLLPAGSALAQFETATVSGQVSDPSGLSVAGARIDLVDIDRSTSISAATNNSGLYRFASVHPGRYRMEVRAVGFRLINFTGLTVNVQDHLEQNFKLTVGSVSESVTVDGGAPLVDTESAAVSTVVDRQFAENLPMNGRSFQTLIQLTPGVVLTANNGYDTGQFSVNGQRASSNYWMVDGVSANIGMSASPLPGNSLGGTLGSTSVLGGTNSLVSVDALQEFRIQTSTFAPEFGRTPGAQISIVTRSGSNQLHGAAFDYLRNDALDANNWFNGVNILNPTPLPKAKERQNDFGGTLGGPILKNKTFFFFSYEGLRLRLPQTALTCVPDANPADPYARQNAQTAMQRYLNAFPLPNGPQCQDGPGSPIPGAFDFNASFSNPATLDAYSIRIDHTLRGGLSVFGRYDYSPSELVQRGGFAALSSVSPTRITTQTGTTGITWAISNLATNDFRFNYSTTDSRSSSYLDNFGGATPLQALPFPGSFTNQNGEFLLQIISLGNNGSAFSAGTSQHNRQRQINFVDNVSVQRGSHSLKFGVDFRRLSPQLAPPAYQQDAYFADMPSAETGNLAVAIVDSSLPGTMLFRNLGIFAQDTWHIVPRLTLTYGLRWDVDFVPKSLSGPNLNAAVGFDLGNLSNLALAPTGTPPYKTTYDNFAPRVGVAYQLAQSASWQTVIRGGFGVFYDLATSEVGSILYSASYPFGSSNFVFGSFPLTGRVANPLPISPPDASNLGLFFALDPNLRLPYTLQWTAAIQQSLGKQQSLTMSYIGSVGRRLLQSAAIYSPNSNLYWANLVTNTSTSDYDALQMQFQRQIAQGLQALASYTWSHSIDTASAGSIGNGSNDISVLNSNINRGPSDFDIRHAMSLGLTYNLPAFRDNSFTRGFLSGWSVENIMQARTAPPVDVYYQFPNLSSGFQTNPRPDVVVDQPFYLYGGAYPGGKAFNPGAFMPPPLNSSGLPLSQGDLPRNALCGFGDFQWDFAVHRDFTIHESVKLQFRAEMFNLLNRPNFGQPSGNLGAPSALNPQFGLSTAMLGQSLAGTGNLGNGAFDPLYQLGGPRSIQFALKLSF